MVTPSPEETKEELKDRTREVADGMQAEAQILGALSGVPGVSPDTRSRALDEAATLVRIAELFQELADNDLKNPRIRPRRRRRAQ